MNRDELLKEIGFSDKYIEALNNYSQFVRHQTIKYTVEKVQFNQSYDSTSLSINPDNLFDSTKIEIKSDSKRIYLNKLQKK